MSEELRSTVVYQEQPFNPLWGLDIGERWGRELGSIDTRQARLESDIIQLDAKVDTYGIKLGDKFDELDAKIDAVAARLDAKIDAVAARLDAKIDAVAARLDAKIDAVEARLDAKIDAVDKRVDKCLIAISRLDERINFLVEARKSDRALMIAMIGGTWATVVGGFVIQFFLR